MNRHYYYRNPGAVLRRIFPKQLNTQGLIILWTVIFLMNFVFIVLVQNVFLYPIKSFSKEEIEKLPYFKECIIEEVNTVESQSAIGGDFYNYYVKYIEVANPDGFWDFSYGFLV